MHGRDQTVTKGKHSVEERQLLHSIYITVEKCENILK
jgi:hypothetical protein